MDVYSGIVSRAFHDCPGVRRSQVAKKERGVEADCVSIWRREAPRLACRVGELLWIWSCVP